jgi:hypothetical protein
MIYFTGFRPQHILRLDDVQSEQAEDAVAAISQAEATTLAEIGNAWTGWVGADVVGCAGFSPVWPGRSAVWALLTNKAGPHMRQITRFVRQKIAEHPDRRLEATVLHGFKAGQQWMKLLGFRNETPGGMECYDPAGRTMMLYSLVRHDRI